LKPGRPNPNQTPTQAGGGCYETPPGRRMQNNQSAQSIQKHNLCRLWLDFSLRKHLLVLLRPLEQNPNRFFFSPAHRLAFASMHPDPSAKRGTVPHRIELKLRDVNQLFNTMDPSPFHDKDLDHDAEEFILSWAREFPLSESVALVVHLSDVPAGQNAQVLVEQAIHNYFAYRSRLNRMEFRQLLQLGRRDLVIGLVFLGTCLISGEALARLSSGTLLNILRESLTIAGWVAMWRPMEIYLYDWWPVHRRGKVFEKLSRMPVEVVGPHKASPQV
jgi:hypothetical protein